MTWLILDSHTWDSLPLLLMGLRISSVQFSCSVMSNSSWPHGMQHARPPCPSPTPGVYSNSCPLSQWCPPTVSSSVIPFSSRPQYLPASGSFPMIPLFAWSGQSSGALASASVLPMNIQDCHRLIDCIWGGLFWGSLHFQLLYLDFTFSWFFSWTVSLNFSSIHLISFF